MLQKGGATTTYSVTGGCRVSNVLEILGALHEILKVDGVNEWFLLTNWSAHHAILSLPIIGKSYEPYILHERKLALGAVRERLSVAIRGKQASGRDSHRRVNSLHDN